MSKPLAPVSTDVVHLQWPLVKVISLAFSALCCMQLPKHLLWVFVTVISDTVKRVVV